jgi:hypothetical protein
MKLRELLDKLIWLLLHLVLVLPIVGFARNVIIEPDYDFFVGGAGGPMTSARWGILALSIFVWIFPIPIAFRKERYGKDAGWTYWKWWFFLIVIAFIGLGTTSEPWVAFLLMLAMAVVGLFFRTSDEVISDIVESVNKDTKLNEVDLKIDNTDTKENYVKNNSENSCVQNAIATNRDVVSTQQPSLAKCSTQQPQIYKGGMIYMISGLPHQFNGSDFERVDTDESVVINGKTLVWNGKNFVAKN